MITAEEIIGVLKLRPLPVEGGLYRQTYVASEEIGAEALPHVTGEQSLSALRSITCLPTSRNRSPRCTVCQRMRSTISTWEIR